MWMTSFRLCQLPAAWLALKSPNEPLAPVLRAFLKAGRPGDLYFNAIMELLLP